jgi:hypothetical protein
VAKIKTIKPQSVYLVEARDGDTPVACKVGIAFDPTARLSELRVGNHLPLRLHSVWLPSMLKKSSAREIEELILSLLRRFAGNGEWLMLPAQPVAAGISAIVDGKDLMWSQWCRELESLPGARLRARKDWVIHG